MKSVDANDSIDTFIQQTSATEPLVSFSRAGDSSGQWIQLLNVLDQPGLPGWPFLTPQKVQMQKCEKCSREFCSVINYRRHVRVHRRPLNVDKESHRIRDMLAAFWDKLSLEEAKEVVSFKDVALKDVPGASVVKAWATSIRTPGVWPLPQDYVRSGSTLLDIIHAKPPGLPISSKELFCILDDASERTFLCAGMAESVQKYVFVGVVAKIALELKNLVACISFLFEQKLVKVWLADKDAEALRCQKLLVEEEEVAKKRLAEMLERKKQRKLRQKEQKARELSVGEKPVLDVNFNSLQELPVVQPSGHSTSTGSNSDAPDMVADVLSFEELVHSLNNGKDVDCEAQIDNEFLNGSSVTSAEQLMDSSNVCRLSWVQKSPRNRRNGFHVGQNIQLVQLEPLEKHVPLRDRGVTESNSLVWRKKSRMENDQDNFRCRSVEAVSQLDENKCEVIIGSISIPVRNYSLRKKDLGLKDVRSSNDTEQGKQKKSNDTKEKAHSYNTQCSGNRTVSKRWRLFNRNETRAELPIQNAHQDFDKDVVGEKLAGRPAYDGSCMQSSALDESHSQSLIASDNRNSREFLPSLSELTALIPGSEFSSVAASAFLAERWKDAITEDHVKLVLSPGPDATGGVSRPENTSANGQC